MDINKSNDITPNKIKKLVDEMKKINKKIDLRNPLISEISNNSLSIVLDESIYNTIAIKERELDVDEINRKKNLNHTTESEKDKWSRMLKYDVPTDESRSL